MRKRVLCDKSETQFALIPTIGIIKQKRHYRFRIGFLLGPFMLSIGCLKREEQGNE